MVQCERCGSRFHSARALRLEFCPRCLLKHDVSARLKTVPPQAAEPAPDSRPRPGPAGEAGPE